MIFKLILCGVIIAGFGYIVGIFFMMTKVKDTKGIDMSTVSAKDFE